MPKALLGVLDGSQPHIAINHCFTGRLLFFRWEERKSNVWEVTMVSSPNICQPQCETTNTGHESGRIEDVSLQKGVGGT